MYGGFMGDHRLTRWAVVFLIIFVLFILLVPEREERYGGAAY
jgi:ABC-type cobalt transport system substrate-binding protein